MRIFQSRLFQRQSVERPVDGIHRQRSPQAYFGTAHPLSVPLAQLLGATRQKGFQQRQPLRGIEILVQQQGFAGVFPQVLYVLPDGWNRMHRFIVAG